MKLTISIQIKIYLGSLWNTDITLAQDKEAYCTLQVWYAQNSNVKKKKKIFIKLPFPLDYYTVKSHAFAF